MYLFFKCYSKCLFWYVIEYLVSYIIIIIILCYWNFVTTISLYNYYVTKKQILFIYYSYIITIMLILIDFFVRIIIR